MSHPYAIAAVTDALRELLTMAMVEANASGLGNADISVTAQAPDLIATTDSPRLNLFLYDVAPNASLANSRLPERSPDGALSTVPMLAIDLSYLMTAYARVELEAEVMLGCGMLAMHENPGLSREQIRSLLDPATPDVTGTLQGAFREKARSLADQFESIRITPRSLKSDEMSKVWSSLQSHYRPTVAYGVTVVMIERPRRARSAPPVLARGVMDRGPITQTTLVPPVPSLLLAAPPNGNAAVRIDEKLKLFGVALDGDNVVVRLRHEHLTDIQLSATGTGGANPALVIRRPDPDNLDAAEKRDIPPFADTCIEVNLSKATPANAWAAGVYLATLSVTRPGETVARTTNSIAVFVAPDADVAGATVTKLPDSKLRVRLTVDPPLRDRQTAALFLGSEQFPPLTATASVAQPTFESTVPAALLVATSKHLLRLRVDGVDTVYIQRDPTDDRKPPTFDPAQFVTIP